MESITCTRCGDHKFVSFCKTCNDLEERDARIHAEARAEFWKELLEEAESHCDRRVELLGPIETSDDAAIRRAMLDGWSAWLLAKKIIDSKRAAILADEPKEIHGDGSGKALPPFDPSNERVCEAAYPDEPKEERGAEVGDLIACVWNGKPNGAIGAYAGSGMTKRGEWTEEPIVLMRRAEVERRIEEARL